MEWSERVGRRVRLRDLHILLAVVQCKSMAKAAEQLAVSKPVVSKVIADFENVLGVRLLERDRHGAEATIYGTALLKRGITVFDELREAVKDIEFLIDPTAGEVRIGSVDPLAAGFVTSIIERLSARYPRITFHLMSADTDSLHRDIRERRFDFLIARRFGALTDDRLDFDFLFDDSYVVVADARSPWARRRKITLAELVGEKWILPSPDSVPGTILGSAMRASGLEYPHTTVVTNSPEVRFNLLTTGRFLTFFSTSSLQFPARPQLKALPVELPKSLVPIGIITLKNRTLSPVARLFIEHAHEVAKPLTKRKL